MKLPPVFSLNCISEISRLPKLVQFENIATISWKTNLRKNKYVCSVLEPAWFVQTVPTYAKPALPLMSLPLATKFSRASLSGWVFLVSFRHFFRAFRLVSPSGTGSVSLVNISMSATTRWSVTFFKVEKMRLARSIILFTRSTILNKAKTLSLYFLIEAGITLNFDNWGANWLKVDGLGDHIHIHLQITIFK